MGRSFANWRPTRNHIRFIRSRTTRNGPNQKSIDLKLGGDNGFTLEFQGTSQANVTNLSYFNGGNIAPPTAYHDYDASPDIYIGSQFSDRMVGDGGDNVFQGADGNDFLYGQGGIDLLYGENGNDTIDGGADGDYIFGGEGSDKLIGDAGDDYIGGGTGQDTLSGGIGNDILDGEDGNDTMRGGAGADTLTGGAGHDEMYAGLNDGDKDVFKFGADAVGSQSNVWASADYIYEFDATDDVIQIDLASGTAAMTFQQVGGNTHVYVKGDFDGVEGTETIAMSFIGGGVTEENLNVLFV